MNLSKSTLRAAALEDIHAQFPVDSHRDVQAKWGGRGIVARRLGPAEEDGCLARQGADLQAPDLLRARLRQPGDDRARAVPFDQLLGGPEALRRSVRTDPHQRILFQAGAQQAGKVRRLRRPYHHDLLPSLCRLAQGPREKAPFQHGGLREKDFGDGPGGEPTAR